MNEDKQIIQIVYKGIEIFYNENDEIYTCEIADYVNKRQSLKVLKGIIDKQIKTEESFIPIKAYMFQYDTPKVITIVSPVERTGYGEIVWIKDENGKRTKERIDSIYLWCVENEKIFKAVDTLEKQITELSKQQNSIKTNLIKQFNSK